MIYSIYSIFHTVQYKSIVYIVLVHIQFIAGIYIIMYITYIFRHTLANTSIS